MSFKKKDDSVYFLKHKSYTIEGICFPGREDNFHMVNDQVVLKVFSADYTMF